MKADGCCQVIVNAIEAEHMIQELKPSPAFEVGIVQWFHCSICRAFRER